MRVNACTDARGRRRRCSVGRVLVLNDPPTRSRQKVRRSRSISPLTRMSTPSVVTSTSQEGHSHLVLERDRSTTWVNSNTDEIGSRQGECQHRRRETEAEIQRRSIACSQYPPCLDVARLDPERQLQFHHGLGGGSLRTSTGTEIEHLQGNAHADGGRG